MRTFSITTFLIALSFPAMPTARFAHAQVTPLPTLNQQFNERGLPSLNQQQYNLLRQQSEGQPQQLSPSIPKNTEIGEHFPVQIHVPRGINIRPLLSTSNVNIQALCQRVLDNPDDISIIDENGLYSVEFLLLQGQVVKGEMLPDGKYRLMNCYELLKRPQKD